MAIMEEPATKWFDESNDDLIRELLDNESPFFVLPRTFESGENHSSDPVTNHLSEPATQDAESVLSATSSNNESMDQSNIFHARVSVLEEKVTSRIDNKYTLKIKSCGTEMADDGYKWRKYGQKSIKNSPHPRSYYRCTNPRCSAKKQVERSSQDPDTLVVTYEGLHLHFTYTHFLLNQPHPHLTHQPTKKAKTNTKGNQSPQIHKTIDSVSPQTHETVTQELPALFDPMPLNTNMSGLQEELWEVGPQGLLEDMVPLIIRKPSNIITLSNSSSSSSYSSSPPTSSSTLTWSPNNSNPW